ncbi:LuxR family transcriptional regulator [uncultured Tateyamaria sp.]|uniref:helix-turn-helix transcriptional regulator n=1 Tax=Tateyamaria sp. 1078 TaxID=3417464 RepID=UPI0026083294|nr:LuxR family transcriptional regulator [uncultured Tateyamaria sp.]
MTEAVFDAIVNEGEVSALWSLVTLYFRDHGVSKISYHHIRSDLQHSQSVNINATGFSSEWTCHYIKQKLYLIDPITELAHSTVSPFRWSQIRELVRLTPEQRAYLGQMREAGVGDGLAFQVFGPGLRNGYVGLGFEHPDQFPDPAAILEFQMIAQAAHVRYCALRPALAPGGELSPRERQILRWIARGKSNSVIAEILSVSPHTVDTLVRRIFSKLGVADRTTAAIQGVGAGLIVP